MLSWLIPRRQALKFLAGDLVADEFADFTQKEVSMMQSILDEQSVTSEIFWATAHLCSQLAGWGAEVSMFFHGCPLVSHSGNRKPWKNCPWKGRMSSRLAQGTWLDSFSQQLLNISTGQAQSFLRKLDDENRQRLSNDFNAAKLAMAQRFIQVYSYWRKLPWRVCAVASCLFYDLEDEDTDLFDLNLQHVQLSKAFAKDVLDQWTVAQNTPDRVCSGNGHVSFHMARRFLDSLYKGNLSAYLVVGQ